jgi:hypothetical protein
MQLTTHTIDNFLETLPHDVYYCIIHDKNDFISVYRKNTYCRNAPYRRVLVLLNFRILFHSLCLKKRFLSYLYWIRRRNYIMILEGTVTSSEHNYMMNEYVGRDIMSYL